MISHCILNLKVLLSQIAESMLNMVLVTHQTGPEGKVVRKVLVEEGLNIVEGDLEIDEKPL